MSQVRTNTLSNTAGTGSPDIVGGELSRARFNLNGTGTIAARDDFNIASYVDNGVGDYTSNFTTAFPNANYSPVAGILGITGGIAFTGNNFSTHPPTTTAFRVASWRQADFTGNATRDDTALTPLAFFGDRP